MEGYITDIVISQVVSTVDDVERLHNDLKRDNRFDLKKFEYQHKDIKIKGEIVDSYEKVKATLSFNNEKEPDQKVKIDFSIDNGFFPSPIVNNDFSDDDIEDDDDEGELF